MGDWDVLQRTIQRANKNKNSKTVIASFVVDSTEQKLFLLTEQQLNVFGITLEDV